MRELAVLAKLLAVIGGDDHDRMIEDSAALELLEEVREGRIEGSDLGPVERGEVRHLVG